MKLWIDDLRDPQKSLTKEELENVLWIKDIREANRFLYSEKSNEIEVIYLDHWMGDGEPLTGGFLLLEVLFGLQTEENICQKLKEIHLHSNDSGAIDESMELEEDFKKFGIILKEAQYKR